MDYYVPIPPKNKNRRFQPVIEITKALGEINDVEVLEDLLTMAEDGEELKNVDDSEERIKLLSDSLTITENPNIKDKNILLIDDIYRSGATLTVATELLYNTGQVKDVYVLTVTKTRSKR